MDISVIICTWNRAESLRKCLESLTQITIPDKIKWEVLIVINGSTDHTREVLFDFENNLPVRFYWEPKQGLSRARNTGIKYAKGELLVFFDDDVMIDRSCLMSFYHAQSLFPDGTLFGGLIEPQIKEGNLKTHRLLKDPFFDGLVLRKNLGPTCRVMNQNEYFFGANFAVRKEVFHQLQFDERLGKKGAQQLAGEEIRLQDEATKRRFIRVWVPGARVLHGIDSNRLHWKEAGRYFWGAGRTHYRLQKSILFPQLPSLTLFGFWAQISFYWGCWWEYLSSRITFIRKSKTC